MAKSTGWPQACWLLLFIWFKPVIAQDHSDLQLEIACTQWRPYAFKENAIISGPAYEIAKKVLKHAGLTFSYKIKPWARVYNNGLTRENYLVGCLGRTAVREKSFHWIGPVTQGFTVFFYKLKSNPIKIDNIEQAKSYDIAMRRSSYNHEFLKSNQFNESKMFPVSSNDQVVKMLLAKRHSFILLNESQLLDISNKQKIDATLFEKALPAFEAKEYMAFSLTTSPDLVKRVRNAYEQLSREGKIVLPQ
mgnify:CR=1 FL=1